MPRLSTLFLLCTAVLLAANDIYVQMTPQSAKAPQGAPCVYSLDKAIRQAQPGDTIHILESPEPIRGSLVLSGKIPSTEDKPITLDAHNNVFLGTMPLKPEEWQMQEGGLYVKTVTLMDYEAARYFLVRQGKHIRMGRWTKAKCAPWKTSESLQPGEYTMQQKAPADKPHRFIYEIILRLPDGCDSLEKGGYEEVVAKWQNGVTLRKGVSWLVIQNVIVRNFLNDGYNIHDASKGVLFRNVAAVDCGDDGISAHNTAEISLDGFFSVGNSTVIAHIQDVTARHRNIYAEETYGFDLMLRNTGNTLENAVFRTHLRRPFLIQADKGKTASLKLKDILLSDSTPGALCTITEKGNNPQGKFTLAAENVKCAGFRAIPEIPGFSQATEQDLAAAEQQRKALLEKFGPRLEKILQERR